MKNCFPPLHCREEPLGEAQAARGRLAQQEAELYQVPDAMKAAVQEVVLPGLMTTITEVEVSVEQKLKSIEQTEALKRRLLDPTSTRWGRRGAAGCWGGRCCCY